MNDIDMADSQAHSDFVDRFGHDPETPADENWVYLRMCELVRIKRSTNDAAVKP